MSKWLDRLPGERELLDAMRAQFPEGATLSELITEVELPDEAASVPQLLEVLIGYGDVTEKDGMYRPASGHEGLSPLEIAREALRKIGFDNRPKNIGAVRELARQAYAQVQHAVRREHGGETQDI